MVVLYIKYEHKIRWATANDNNLDISTVRSASELSVVPYFTSSSLLSRPCPNSTRCTLYGRKNRTNSYDFLRITRVNALLLSVYFKPVFVDIASLYAELGVFDFSTGVMVNIIFIILHALKHYEFFHSVSQTLLFFS